ncbi:MAG: acetylornithine deacetylase [Gammaproteobacteria bacterium]|nr:MAG: acetylornithine deacetylase [Gammaproteobacteria bacterium]
MKNLTKTYQAQLDAIDAQHDDLVKTLIDWAHINSGSYNIAGVNAYREVVQAAFAELTDDNDQVEVVSLPTFDVVNDAGEVVEQHVADGLIIRKRPECQKRVLLCAHLDTVFPKDHHFQRCQYLDDNTLNGPGVADIKGGILLMLTALKALESHAVAKNIGWDVFLVPDEEIGSLSSNTLYPQFAGNTFGMIYEPSPATGEFVGERKGSGNFSIVVKGRASHAGRAFYDGRNAIAKLARIVADMHDLNDPAHSTTLNIGTISGGQALNVVPELAIAKFNIRVASDEDASDILAKVDAILDNYREDDYEIFRHGKLSRPAKPMDAAQQQLFAVLKDIHAQLGLPTEIIATGGCCDGNNFKALGVPNIDTLGVRGGMIHSDQEFVLLDSLTERAKLSALLLLAFADGSIALG